MAVELSAHNAHNVLGQSSLDASILSGIGAGGLQATYVYITEALDGVKSIFQDDIGLPKAEFLSKYTERYGEVSLRFMRGILYCIVKRRKGLTLPNLIERKQTEGVKEKLVKDIYDIFAFGEGIKDNLPKQLLSTSGRQQEVASPVEDPTLGNLMARPSVNQASVSQEVMKYVTNTINECKATTFQELLRYRNELSDLRNELQRVKEKQDGGQEEPVIVMCFNANLANNERPAEHSDMAKQYTARSENDGASSNSTNENENKKNSKSKVLLVSDSLLHKLDVKRFFVKGSETVKLAKSGNTVNGTSERAFNYITEHKNDVFEAIVLLAGTYDIKSNYNEQYCSGVIENSPRFA